MYLTQTTFCLQLDYLAYTWVITMSSACPINPMVQLGMMLAVTLLMAILSWREREREGLQDSTRVMAELDIPCQSYTIPTGAKELTSVLISGHSRDCSCINSTLCTGSV